MNIEAARRALHELYSIAMRPGPGRTPPRPGSLTERTLNLVGHALRALGDDAQAILDSEIPMNRPEPQALGPDTRYPMIACMPCDYGAANLTRLVHEANERVAAALSIPRQLICVPVADPWREHVLDQCATACLDGDFSDPRATLARLITWHVQMALDPRISEAAAALVLATKTEALEWAATQCDDTAKSAAKMAREGGTAFDDGREHAAQELAAEMRAGKGYTS